MTHIALPGKGCFNASYPSTVWNEVTCVTAPQRPYRGAVAAARAPRSTVLGDGSAGTNIGPAVIGNGADYAAQVTSGLISSATGSFKSVTGAQSESDGGSNNRFSLQLNTEFFSTSVCKDAPDASCQGWQQFIYSNSGVAFVQYWLIGWGSPCPSGWNTSGSDCWRNSTNSVGVPVQSITELADLRLTGTVSSGGQDTVYMTTSDGTVHAANQDSVLDLAKSWKLAEFNLFGDCCGSEANVNGGMTIVVQTSVENGTKNAPLCEADDGFTGETNNLSFSSACTATGGSAPAIEFTESTPPTSIWIATGTPCTGNSCPGWEKLDDNENSVRIAGGGSNFYQLANTGKIWQYTGPACSGSSCPGWTLLDDNPITLQIAADGSDLYQLLNTGVVQKYTGGVWKQLDSDKTIVTIVTSGSNLYELRNTGHVWGNTGSGWREFDSNPNVVQIAAEGNNLYEVHSNGEIWGLTDTPCTGSGCPAWQKLDDNSTTLRIIASSGGLYQLHTTGAIYHYTGTPCSGTSCRGWVELDNNPLAVDIAGTDGNLWELHSTGAVYQYTGTPCSGGSCPGWVKLDDNAATGRIEAGGDHVYEMHIPLVLHSRSLSCYECR